MSTSGDFVQVTPADSLFQAIVRLDAEQFPLPWSEVGWRELNWQMHLLFSSPDGSGFIFYQHLPGDSQAHLLKICVAQAYRGSSLASELFRYSLAVLKLRHVTSIYLEVEASNNRALAFYIKQGFRKLREIKGYYSNRENAITMAMEL